MATQRPLQELILPFLDHIDYYENSIELQSKLYDLYKGRVSVHLLEKIEADINSASARKAMSERLMPVNIVPSYIDKVSKLYDKRPFRSSELEADQMLMSDFENDLALDVVLQQAAEIVNLHGRCLIEPFLHNDGPKLRVVPAHKFIPWSDDKVNPANPTVIIKFMGFIRDFEDSVDVRGDKLEDNERLVENIKLYHAWSEDEFLIFDSNGGIRFDLMQELGIEGTENPLGEMPFIYVTNDDTELIPFPDEALFRVATTIPLLLADLNFAVKYLSHSIMYATNVDPSSFVNSGADSIMFLQAPEENPDATPSLDAITPNVDSDKALTLIREQLAMWLESRGLKASTNGGEDNNSLSGVAKMIDNADVTAKVDIHKVLFKDVERRLWGLLSTLHNEVWEISLSKFSNSFEMSIEFGDSKPFIDANEELNKQEKLLELGLVSKKFALKRIFPEMEEEEIEQILEEASAETLSQIAAFTEESQESNEEDAEGDTGGDSGGDE